MKNAYSQRGVTLLELLLVISIVTIIAGSSAPFYSRFIRKNNHALMVDKIVGTIRKAQANSMHGKNNAVWGICINGTDLRLYTGSCSSPTISEDFEIPGSVNVTGLTTTTFSQRRGEPSGTLSISVTSDIESTTIDMSAVGGIDVN